MGVKVATTCLQWTQPIASRLPSSTVTSKRRNRSYTAIYAQGGIERLSLFRSATKLQRAKSCENYPFNYSRTPTLKLKRGCSAGLDSFFSDEEFSKKIQELALRFQSTEDYAGDSSQDSSVQLPYSESTPWREIGEEEPPDWSCSIERNANSIDLPHSMRIIKRKLQWQEGFREAGESAYCSVKKAFSSMVFIIRELHSYSLQMREMLFTEDLQGILVRVHTEMHASFVWLFQQVFSQTPVLMVSVMILLANFTVNSVSNYAIAAAPPVGYYSVATSDEQQDDSNKFDSSSIKTFTISSSTGKNTCVGGNNGGGGNIRPVSSGTDGDGGLNESERFKTIVPDGGSSQLSSTGRGSNEVKSESISSQDETSLWNSTIEEAAKMRGEPIDNGAMQRFVSPVKADIEAEDQWDYLRTEFTYQNGLAQEPNNVLLLANYAQFLYLVAQDFDRAEEYFKRAVGVEPADAEAYSKYATFLWKVKNDLWAAEETYLEAISAEPSNSYYAANYAHFLWNTGGEDTCYPVDSPPQQDI
ncbi:hypothetical protein ACFE04_012716 [Oxalis oulophora]